MLANAIHFTVVEYYDTQKLQCLQNWLAVFKLTGEAGLVCGKIFSISSNKVNETS